MQAPSTAPRREITPRVVVLGLVLSVVMGAANVYVGLKAGMTVSASIPAAVVAMLVFRLFFRSKSILEANQVQTCASAGESLAAGIIFTMPALVLIGYWEHFDFLTVTAVAFTGGLLGVLLMIPMRRVFVADNEELPYPEGIACAAVLEAGDDHESSEGAGALVLGGFVGALFKACGSFLGLFRDTLEGARALGSHVFYAGSDISPMLVAVGFIVRLNVAVLIFVGGAIAWLIGIPLAGGSWGEDTVALDRAWSLWSTEIRYVGVGAMVVGGIASIVAVRRGLVEAVRELAAGLKGRPHEPDETQRDLSSKAILWLTILSVALVAAVYWHFTRSPEVTVLSTGVMIVMAFFFTAVASYIVGLVGNSNSPVSGMTITAVLFTGGMLWLAGFRGPETMVPTLGVAAVICCVACTSGDVCNDLKTGSLVGAAPFRQQIMQILGVAVAALVMAPVLMLLERGTEGGIGGRALPAPQASLFASLARGFAGEGTLPWNRIAVGAGIGCAILILDGLLAARHSKFRLHLMPIAVGMYLPFGLAPPILLGGLIAHAATRGVPAAEEHRVLHKGVLFSSGVIAGEALMGVGLAGLAVAGISKLDLSLPAWGIDALSVAAFAGVLWMFSRLARSRVE